MESTGEMLCMEHIVELRDSHALEFCAHPSDEYKTYAEDKKPRRQKLRNNTGSLRFVGGGVIAEQDVQGGGDEDLIDTKEAKDLADRIVAFGDKVYTELVSSDPIQLGCPFRSLYAGFERNWSIYKVLQTIAKIILALIVVAAAKSVKTSGLLISICYFFVGVLSKYSQPFIVPVDDLVELISKITALTTAAGATAVAYVSQAAKTSSTAVVHVNCFMGFVVIVHCLNMAAMVLALAMGVSASRGLIKSCLGWLLFSDTLRGFEDGRAKNIIPHWNVDKEAKHRVWQSFLRAILLELAVSSEASDIGN
ncbi:hypothetical protein PC112_g17294 [Phytophthora cactorum]|nr:hypothetical protein PC112_g17294 [Phytophthora cactorum]